MVSPDEVIDFVYPRNKLWESMRLTKEQFRDYILRPYVSCIIVCDKDKIVCVGIYLKDKTHIHFISVTVKEGYNGLKVIRFGIREAIRKEKPKIISWLTPEYRLKTMEVTKCHQQ